MGREGRRGLVELSSPAFDFAMSFVKLKSNGGGSESGVELRGVRSSARGSGRMTSTGVLDLDEILGGGLPVGSVVCLREKGGTSHMNALAACFMAEGVAHGHAVAVATAEDYPANAFAAMPARMHSNKSVEDERKASSSNASSEADDIRIAWRYRRYDPSSGGSSNSARTPSTYCYELDLSQSDGGDLSGRKVSLLGLGQSVQLVTVLEKIKMHVAAAMRAGVAVRIVFRELGSALWEGDVVKFVRELRSLARGSNTVCLLTTRGEGQ